MGAVMVLAALTGCGSGASSSRGAQQTTATLRVLVTNDDGVGAPGIDTVVEALRKVPSTEVTVVAPSTNRSTTGGKTTTGQLTATRAATASGYPAWAVNGYPADTIAWAIDDHGVSFRPDLVVSGINSGQNLGPLVDVSGTVGAARAAAQRGIPALAASQGIDNGVPPDFAQGVAQVEAWVEANRAGLLGHGYGTSPPEANLNVPTCPTGRIRGPVSAPLATTLAGITITRVDCSSTSTSFANDAEAFVLGYAVISPLQAAPGT